jgi:co-chaperonin GroES (HSP10)
MRTEEVRAARDKAVIELEEKVTVRDSGLHVIRDHQKKYDPADDFEIGVVTSLGVGDSWEPVTVGDRVMVRAISGGEAGADIGQSIGRGRGEVIVVEREEMVCKLER